MNLSCSSAPASADDTAEASKSKRPRRQYCIGYNNHVAQSMLARGLGVQEAHAQSGVPLQTLYKWRQKEQLQQQPQQQPQHEILLHHHHHQQQQQREAVEGEGEGISRVPEGEHGQAHLGDAGHTALQGRIKLSRRAKAHLAFYDPLQVFYDSEKRRNGKPPTRDALAAHLQELHSSRPCGCGKAEWKPSRDWMTNWYASVGLGAGSHRMKRASASETAVPSDEGGAMEQLQQGLASLGFVPPDGPSMEEQGGPTTFMYQGPDDECSAAAKESNLGVPRCRPVAEAPPVERHGFVREVEVGARGLAAPFQPFARKPDGRNNPLAVAAAGVTPAQATVERVSVGFGGYRVAAHGRDLTDPSAGLVPYGFVAAHEHCFRAALARWGGEPPKLSLDDPGVLCQITIPPIDLLTKGGSAGCVVALAIILSMAETDARPDVASTGALDLHGNLLMIGCLRNKVVSAYNAGMSVLVAPRMCVAALEQRQAWVGSRLQELAHGKDSAARKKERAVLEAELLPEVVRQNLQVVPGDSILDVLRVAAPELRLSHDFQLQPRRLARCNVVLCDDEAGGIAWLEVATVQAPARDGVTQVCGQLQTRGHLRGAFFFRLAQEAALRALPQWLELVGLPVQVDLAHLVDVASGRPLDLIVNFNCSTGDVPATGQVATSLVVAMLALAVGRQLPHTLALGNGFDLDSRLYLHPGMGQSEARVAARAGLKTLILHTNNAHDVRAAVEAEASGIEVLGAADIPEVMGHVASMLITPA